MHKRSTSEKVLGVFREALWCVTESYLQHMRPMKLLSQCEVSKIMEAAIGLCNACLAQLDDDVLLFSARTR